MGVEGLEDAVMPLERAKTLAQERNLDLVKVVPNAQPPVCRIMDYGKYCFEMNKKEKEAKKKQKIVEVKEVRLSLGIDVNDLRTKTSNAQRFLKAGNKVKVTIRFRGREMAHTRLGETLLKKFAAECEELSVIERTPKLDGRSMIMILNPNVK